MSNGASIAVVGLVLSNAALVMIILLYSRPAVIGVFDQAETQTAGMPDAGNDANTCTAESACKEKTPAFVPHTYVMTYENYSRPYGYLDENDNLKGVLIDILSEACRRAGQQCVHVYRGKASKMCWDYRTKIGIGLHRRYYDACVNWSITKERNRVFQFTKPMIAKSFWHIYTNDPENTIDMIFTKKFAFVTSWVSSPYCIEEHFKKKVPPENIVEAVDLDDLRGKLKRKEVSFVILGAEEPEFIKLPGNLNCGRTGGYSIMCRYDSHIPVWFNPTFLEMRKDGTYDRLCKAAEKRHGAAADCLPKPDDSDE